ncbi:recombinase family protein [Aestuariivirga sp.]|uniref:recombinase family protein n=1 Tax=Aestuariivirga sp. TaxID=2650926 RepID=UPI003BAB6A7C
MCDARDGERSGIVRCAIYTRKSSEEGLEQAFNSLDAQREACEAYIRSQKHEGWTLLPEFYDDGGISGGTLERPALKRLLADIEADRIDTVVVYKVDRLTRSLCDFSKIVSVFDARGASFVSITQQFNTTTSMGRLTLNMLLSFAQFEREVTGERIRDKVAASKKKGMWMGGVVPLGYEVKDRKLVVNDAEAGTIRLIYGRYLELGSVRLLAEELAQQGICGKAIPRKDAAAQHGASLARGALYRILSNRLYLGQVHHQGNHYPGEHEPIIDRDLWDRVAQLLADNRADRKHGTSAEAPSLLAGLLYDPMGEPLTASHASKGGRRYRYYVSRSLVTAARADSPDGLRLPAGEIEGLVETRLTSLFANAGELHQVIGSKIDDAARLSQAIGMGQTLSRDWKTLAVSRRRAILAHAIQRVTVSREKVDISLAPQRFLAVLAAWPNLPNLTALSSSDPRVNTVTLAVPAMLNRSGVGKQMIIAGATATEPDPSLVKLLVKAFDLRAALLAGQGATLERIAARQEINSSYATRLLRLSFLSPEIICIILDGGHPPTLTARTLLCDTRLPIAWRDQLLALP